MSKNHFKIKKIKNQSKDIYKSYESQILRKLFKPKSVFFKLYDTKSDEKLTNDYFKTVYCISTGSQAGNSYVVSDDTDNYLIDYGLSMSKINNFLRINNLNIKESFYSHKHQDHYNDNVFKTYSQLGLIKLDDVENNSTQLPIYFDLTHTNAQYKGSKHHLGLEHIENRGLIFKNLIYITDTGLVDDETIAKINTLDFSKYPYVILMIENNYCFHSVMDNFNGDEANVLKRSLADDGHMSCLAMYATYVKLKINNLKPIYLHGSSNKGKFECPFEYEPYRAVIGKVWEFDE